MVDLNVSEYFPGGIGVGGSELVAGFYKNLAVDGPNNTQVDIKSGTKVGMDDGSEVVTLIGDASVDITASGLNGLDTGAEAPNTWYYIYVITDGVTPGGLLSVSPTAPTLPVNYTKKRLVGAVRNNGSSNFFQFVQKGAVVSYSETIVFSGFNNPTLTSFSVASLVPVPIVDSIAGWAFVSNNWGIPSGGTNEPILNLFISSQTIRNARPSYYDIENGSTGHHIYHRHGVSLSTLASDGLIWAQVNINQANSQFWITTHTLNI